MIIDAVKSAILSNIGPLKQSSKNWHIRNCMLCHTQGHGKDTRKRFGIQFNADSILINCFNCGFSTHYTEAEPLTKSFKFFLTQLAVDDKFIAQLEFEKFKQKNNIIQLKDGDTITSNYEDKFKSLFSKWKEHPLPPDSYPIQDWLDAGCTDKHFIDVAQYAVSRGITDFDQFYWSPSEVHEMNCRLILPYYYRGTVVGYTGRYVYKINNKEVTKYFQRCPTDFVYNLDNQYSWSRKYVIVNEGVLDAWVVDGVGILGEVTQHKVDIINRLQKDIIVCPDRDKKGSDLVKAAIHNNWAVSFPKWDAGIKDAADASKKYGRLLTTYSIIQGAVRKKEKIKLLWNISQNERNRSRNS